MQINVLYHSLSYHKLRKVLGIIAIFFSVVASYQTHGEEIYLKDPQSNKCLDSSNGNVYPHDCNQGAWQGWSFNGYAIKHTQSSMCLDSNYSGSVYAMDCNSGNYQNWDIIPTGAGGRAIRNRQTGLCLDSNDQWIWTTACDNTYWQSWDQLPSVTVAFFDDANYGRHIVSLGEGNYDLGAWKNDALSSLRVPSGLRVTLYSDANFSGRQKVLSSDTNYVGNDFNDITTSVKIEKITTPSNCIASGALNGNPLNSDQYFNAAESFASYFIDKGLGNFPFFGGGYQVRLARHDMQCVNVKGSWPYDGGDVIVYPCTNTIFYPVNEQWDFNISQTTGFGSMTSRLTDGETRRGMCTEAAGADFTGSQLWNKLTRNCNGNDNQRFALLPIRDTEFLLFHKGSMQCMRYDGSKLRTAECNKDDPEQLLQLCKPGQQCISPPAYICP